MVNPAIRRPWRECCYAPDPRWIRRCVVAFVYFDIVEWTIEAVLMAALLTESMGLALLAHRWVSR